VDSFDFGADPGRVEVSLHDSVDEFRAVAEPWYRHDPVVHTIELTQLRSAETPTGSLMLTVWDGAQLVGAALQSPPYPLLTSGLGVVGIACAATELAQVKPDLDGVRGLRSTVVAFAEVWQAVTGTTATVAMRERLYRLGMLRDPEVDGSPRDAEASDRGQLVDWLDGFFGEADGDEPDGDEPDPDRCQRYIESAELMDDRFVVWVRDDVPVSMAMVRAPAAGVSRIGPVFTPGDLRGHGYGSAVTAAAARQARQRGAHDVVLFADLANPVSNGIYQRIGFQPVADSARIAFTGERVR
jgi:GNAT superfamily N-acetyltransferase